jgi:hypothetical protein
MEGDFKTRFVNNHGIAYSCDNHPNILQSDTRILLMREDDIRCIKNGDSFYVNTSALAFWFMNFYPVIKRMGKKIILVSGDSDVSTPMRLFGRVENLDLVIKDNIIIHWFCQNCDLEEDSPYYSFITPIPIGIDYHSIHRNSYFGEIKQHYSIQDETLYKLHIENLNKWHTKKTNVLLDAHLTSHTNPTDRTGAYNSLKDKSFSVFLPKSLPRTEYWKFISQYKYILSPIGNGLDCHRTWEAITLGIVPIVKKTSLKPLFKDLPVLIVESYDDITQELIDSYIYPDSDTPKSAIYLHYWIDKIIKVKEAYFKQALLDLPAD